MIWDWRDGSTVIRLSALDGDPGSVSSIYMMHNTVYNSNPGDLMTSSGLCGYCERTQACQTELDHLISHPREQTDFGKLHSDLHELKHAYMHTYTHTNHAHACNVF